MKFILNLMALKLNRNLLNLPRAAFSTTPTGGLNTSGGSILELGNASKFCQEHVKKFDFYAYRAGSHIPAKSQPYYFAINAFFLEILRSREISREQSICQTRLQWWQ